MNINERLILLIATLLKYPGVGYQQYDDDNQNHHNALLELQQKMNQLGKTLGKDINPSTATLRKDLTTLRQWGLLEDRMYRHGYYLGTAVIDKDELKILFDGLNSQANNQGDPRLRALYNKLEKRLRGFALENDEDFFYPVRQNLNRTINYTDPIDIKKHSGKNDTLFHHINTIEQAIVQGNALEIILLRDPWNNWQQKIFTVYPLQLIFYDIGWYLAYEDCESGHLVINRINRYANHCLVIKELQRDIKLQYQQLQQVEKLLNNGWGLNLGTLAQQQNELAAVAQLIRVKVRFYDFMISFIQEGDNRHPKQILKPGPKDPLSGKLQYIDYCLKLPERSLPEFAIWVQRYMEYAQIIQPETLVTEALRKARNLVKRYEQ